MGLKVLFPIPEGFKGKEIDIAVFPDSFFLSTHSYNALLMSRFFYSAFSFHEYMLIVQLDALVLKDDLEYWCNCGYSYIGAPWFKGFSAPEEPYTLFGVGNGGFSLRSIHDCLKVLSGHKYIPKIECADDCNAQPSFKRFLRDRVLFAHNRYPFTPKTNEDLFWGYYVPAAVRWYKVADITAALNFSFELMPRLMHKLNDYKLPFGCHAWEKYDSEFWLEQLGADFFDSHEDSINYFMSL